MGKIFLLPRGDTNSNWCCRCVPVPEAAADVAVVWARSSLPAVFILLFAADIMTLVTGHELISRLVTMCSNFHRITARAGWQQFDMAAMDTALKLLQTPSFNPVHYGAVTKLFTTAFHCPRLCCPNDVLDYYNITVFESVILWLRVCQLSLESNNVPWDRCVQHDWSYQHQPTKAMRSR